MGVAADSPAALANWSGPSELTSSELAGPRPFFPSIVWKSAPKMMRIRLLASSGCFDFAEMPMFAPPARTGAAPPSLPGRTNVPKVASFQVRTGLLSFVVRSPIDQCAQPGAMIVAAASEVPVVDLSVLVAVSVSLR